MIEYKSGTMTSKVNGDVIHVVDVEPLNTFDSDHRWATEVATGYHRVYYMKHWDFEPDKISIYDLFDSFEVGTKFLWLNHNGGHMHRNFEKGDEYYWLKVGNDQMVYTSSRGKVVVPEWPNAVPILSARNNFENDHTIEAI